MKGVIELYVTISQHAIIKKHYRIICTGSGNRFFHDYGDN